jgi:hypothetical protein
MTFAWHPETDGQTERVNKCLEGLLRCFVSSYQMNMADWIPLAEFWYNTTIHSMLGKTPFEVRYGHAPRHFGVDIVESCAILDLHQWLSERERVTALLWNCSLFTGYSHGYPLNPRVVLSSFGGATGDYEFWMQPSGDG